MYRFMGKDYKTEKEAIVAWSKQDEIKRQFYSIYRNGYDELRPYFVTVEELRKITKGMNNKMVEFPNSDKVYFYRKFDNIDFTKIDNVTFSETRGMYGNLVAWLRVYNINGKLIGFC